MLTLNKIREDLKEIRYYYSRKALFDENSRCVAPNAILNKARKYNEAVKTAKPILYDVYICLYVKNYTQGRSVSGTRLHARIYPDAAQTAVIVSAKQNRGIRRTELVCFKKLSGYGLDFFGDGFLFIHA